MQTPSGKSITVALLWIATGWVLFYAVVFLSLTWNLFSWTPNTDPPAVISLVIAVLLLPCLWLLATHTRGTLDTWVAFITTATLAMVAIYALIGNHQEGISDSFLGRSTLSPHWFHLLTSALLIAPAILWWAIPFQRWRRRPRPVERT